MEVTESGMVTMYDVDVPSGKAGGEKFGRFSLEETSALIKTFVSAVEEKASLPMEVTESGMVTEVN